MPDTWKWKDISADYKQKDKKDRKHVLHIKAVTDVNGMASCEVELSRFGGDVFTPAAYIQQDAHLAKYVEGEAKLEDRKPVFAKKAIKVWRKFWYQMTQPKNFGAPQPRAAESAYSHVKADMLFDNQVEFDEASAPPRTYYEKYIIEGGSDTTKVAVVGSHNKDAFKTLLVNNASAPIKNHLIVCGYQYDEDPKPTKRGFASIISMPASRKVTIHMGKPVFDPPLQGGNMVVEAFWVQGGSTTKNPIFIGDISIPKPRAWIDQVEISLPTGLKPSTTKPITVYVRCLAAKGPFLGESMGQHSLIVYDSNDKIDFYDTVTHEIGHSFNQTPKPDLQPATTPQHPFWFDNGQGVHCNNGNKKCVMYEDGPNATAIHKYCEVCHPYLLVEDMSKFK